MFAGLFKSRNFTIHGKTKGTNMSLITTSETLIDNCTIGTAAFTLDRYFPGVSV